MSGIRREHCFGCRFWLPVKKGLAIFPEVDGVCRRHAPIGPVNGGAHEWWTIFPPMPAAMWCGEYAALRPGAYALRESDLRATDSFLFQDQPSPEETEVETTPSLQDEITAKVSANLERLQASDELSPTSKSPASGSAQSEAHQHAGPCFGAWFRSALSKILPAAWRKGGSK